MTRKQWRALFVLARQVEEAGCTIKSKYKTNLEAQIIFDIGCDVLQMRLGRGLHFIRTEYSSANHKRLRATCQKIPKLP